MTDAMCFAAGYEGEPLTRMVMNLVAPSPSLTTSFAMSAMKSMSVRWNATKSSDCEAADAWKLISVPPTALLASHSDHVVHGGVAFNGDAVVGFVCGGGEELLKGIWGHGAVCADDAEGGGHV
jgi:hypothetical protein